MSFILCNTCGKQNFLGEGFCSSCGASLPGVTLDRAGKAGVPEETKLRGDRYLILGQLFSDQFSRTYLAADTSRADEKVAISKLIVPEKEAIALQEAEEVLQKEAIALHFIEHPQIPRFWEIFQEDRGLFLVEDFIEGQKSYQVLLNQRKWQGKTFREAEIVQLLRQILPVLSYLHQQGIIHRYICPNNITLAANSKLPYLIDIGGIKKKAVELLTNEAGRIPRGKVGYAPDEQLRFNIAAPHSDLYALGVTAVVLMSGKPPHKLFDVYTMSWIWKRLLNLSPPVSQMLDRMLHPTPSHRFQSAEEILQWLEENEADVPPIEPATEVEESQAIAPPPDNTFEPTPANINNSGCGDIFDPSIPIPAEIKRWNWGAFVLPGLWSLSNKVWIGLLAWGGFLSHPISGLIVWLVAGLILGLKGNEWAWKSCHWKSVSAFKDHQIGWAVPAVLILASLGLLFLLGLSYIL